MNILVECPHCNEENDVSRFIDVLEVDQQADCTCDTCEKVFEVYI